MIVRNSKQAIVFSAFGLFRVDFLSYLNIYLFVLSRCNKVYLAVGDLTDIDSVSPAAKFKVNDVFKAGGDGIGIVAKNAVPE